MKFMLHCRKFCPEIRVSRVAKGMSTPVVRTGSPGQAGLKNVEGKAQRRRQYASTARSCNAAIGIFSGPRLRPAFMPGQAGMKNVEGKARRHRQYASTARSCNAAIGIFSGPRLRPAFMPGQAGLKNVEGKAQRRRQYASTARSCNAAIGIFSGPRLRPAVVKPCAYKCTALLNLAALAPKPPLCAARLYNLSFPSHISQPLPCQHN